MDCEAAPISSSSMPEAPANGKLRPLTLADIDRRTRAYQAADRLLGDLIADLGGERAVTAGQRELAKRAAVMTALIEDTEAKALRGDAIDLTAYLASVNSLRRVLATVGLERRARTISRDDPLEYAAQQAGAA